MTNIKDKVKEKIKQYSNDEYFGDGDIIKGKAIYYSDCCFCFGSDCDLYITNKCTINNNYVGNGSYDVPEKYELNNGKETFRVSSYEVYLIEF